MHDVHMTRVAQHSFSRGGTWDDDYEHPITNETKFTLFSGTITNARLDFDDPSYINASYTYNLAIREDTHKAMLFITKLTIQNPARWDM